MTQMTFAICLIIILSVNLIIALMLNHKILNEWENTIDELEDVLDKLEQYELELSELNTSKERR